MWWGGLRGSVGLALAITIQHTTYDVTMWGGKGTMIDGTYSLDCRDQPSTVVAMTVVVVTLTVVINGVTMAPLMKLLRMTDVRASPVHTHTHTHVHGSAHTCMYVHLRMRRHPCIGESWVEVCMQHMHMHMHMHDPPQGVDHALCM